METLNMPLREMRKRYKKSEIAIMGWRSAETSYKLRLSTKRPSSSTGSLDPSNTGHTVSEVANEVKRQIPKAVDDDGELNLSKLTGDQAMRVLGAMGVNFIPMM